VPGSEKQLVGRRVLAPLEFWLQHLHELPTHGNRNLLADHVLVAHLVAFLSPALKSLRRIESVFDHRLARQRFGLPRVPKSTLSDAQAIFDPGLLEPIIADLRQRVPHLPHDPKLDALLKTLTAVDGSFFRLAPRVWWALYAKPNATPRQPRQQNQHGNVRVDVHFNVLSGVPEQAILTNGRTPEYETLRTHLQPDRFYVLDRGYHSYETLGAIVAAGSDFLVRLRSDMQFEPRAELPLTPAQQSAGVQRVQLVQPLGQRARQALGDLPLKLVTLRPPGGSALGPSGSSSGSRDGSAPCQADGSAPCRPDGSAPGRADGSPLRLLSNRTDLDAELFGLVYRYRWQIELFFRWLKCLVNFQHFFSEQPDGLALQIGAAVIGTLLLALVIQDRPSSYDWAMLTHVVGGLLPLDQETLEIMAHRRTERARAAKWQKEYRARKKTAK